MRIHYQIDARQRRVSWQPASWLGRILTVFTAAGLLVLGFFFLTFLLAIAAVAFVVMAIRWWWFAKKVQRNESAEVIEVQSVVVHDDAADPPLAKALDKPLSYQIASRPRIGQGLAPRHRILPFGCLSMRVIPARLPDKELRQAGMGGPGPVDRL